VLLYGLIAASSRPSDYAVIGDPLSIEPYAVMMRSGDEAFKRIVDGEIARLMHDGSIHGIYDKWFSRPIPPHGINLNMPMGALLRDLIRYPADKFE
jgi:glutamate/aspartate transport system substrate-binding protein